MHGLSRHIDWPDLRLFLAIADGGSLSAAGRQLGIDQSTAGRRLTLLEQRLGTPLFERTPRRMLPTDAGTAIIDNARRIEAEARAIERIVQGHATGLAGEVRVTAAEGLGTEWLAREIVDFHNNHPDIVINALVTSAAADLVNREADIALRLGSPGAPELIARRLVNIGFGLYASRDYIERHGAPGTTDQLAGHRRVALDLVTGSGRTDPHLMAEAAPIANIGFRSNSPAATLAATRAGLGIGVHSHRWASLYPELVRVLPDQNAGETELWLVARDDLRHSARLRAVYDFIAERILAQKSTFERGL